MIRIVLKLNEKLKKLAELGFGKEIENPSEYNWRFRVPDGEVVSFPDGRCGELSYTAGKDFGDFVVWSRDDVTAYELAVVVDDISMEVTEVVRGEDLLLSTARQILLYRALGAVTPDFYHCPLVCDEDGVRLAKRHDSLSLREIRASGGDFQSVLQRFGDER